MAEYALRLKNGEDTAPRVRMGDALALQPVGPLETRGGLRRDGGGEVSVITGTMSVQVAPFSAWVPGGIAVTQGGFPFVLDDTKVLAIDPGDSTSERTDTVAVVINEDAFDGSGDTSASVVVVKGTPGAGAPVLPETALPLRDIVVPAGASTGTGGLSSGNLGADRRRYLSVGIVPVVSATDRDGLNAQPGQMVYRLDTNKVEVYDGASWGSLEPETLPWHATVGTGGTVTVNSTTPNEIIAISPNNPGTSAVYLVNATVDMDTTGASGATLVAQLSVNEDGSADRPVLVLSGGVRTTVSGTWLVSGQPAGFLRFGIEVFRSGSGACAVRPNQSSIVIHRLR